MNQVSNFISIAAHYDVSTLLTKNGELVHVIQIKGFTERFKGNVTTDLRNVVREAINELINERVLFNIYSKRDYTNILSDESFTFEFAKLKHEMWFKANKFDDCLMNTLYIAIIHEGAKNLLRIKNSFQNFFVKKFQALFENTLQKAAEELDGISVNLLQRLEQYGATLLSIIQKNDQFISKPLSFIYYLLHSQTKDIEISQADYANILSHNFEIKNTYNQACVITQKDIAIDMNGDVKISSSYGENISHYIVMFTLKACYDLPISYTDQVLNLNQQMLITESIYMCDARQYIQSLDNKKKLFEVSKMDIGIQSISAIQESIQSSKVICSQTSIKVFANTSELLNTQLTQTKNLLFKLGITAIREDYNMLGTFFSILPGNSHYFRRQNYGTLKTSCIFSSISPKSLGGYGGSLWGKPITIFRTTEGLPYFFNFHDKNNIGHTIMIGKEKYGLNLLLNFLISESFKFDLKYIDFHSNGIDNEVVFMNQTRALLSINILNECNAEKFCQLILFTLFNHTITSTDEKNNLNEMLMRIHQYITTHKDSAIETLESEVFNIIASRENSVLNSEVRETLQEFFKMNCFFQLFHNDFQISQNIVINDFQSVSIQNDRIHSMLTFLNLQKLNKQIPSTNTQNILITVKSNLLDISTIFENELIQILDDLAKKNIVIIFICNDKSEILNTHNIFNIIQKFIPTRIFLADKFFDNQFKSMFDLSHTDINKIKMYSPNECIFFLKQNDQSVTASFKQLNSITIQK